MPAESGMPRPRDDGVYGTLAALLRGQPATWPERGDEAWSGAFLEAAETQGVAALLHDRACHAEVGPALPALVVERLAQQARVHAAIEMARAHDLRRLRSSLAAAGIRALLLKGASLAYTHYRQPYLRLGVDTDFLVGLDAIEATRRVFEESGFRVMHTRYKNHQFGCARAGPGGVLLAYDVHWRASNRARFARVLPFEDAWREAVTIGELDGWHALGPVHALMLACMHRAANPGHDPNRLIWLHDVHLLVEGLSDTELRRFGERACASGIQGVCLDALMAAEQALGTAVPVALREVLSLPVAGRGLRRAFVDSQLGLLMDDMRHLPGLQARASLLRELLLPTGGELLDRFGKEARAWLPLLYLRYLLGGLWRRLTLN